MTESPFNIGLNEIELRLSSVEQRRASPLLAPGVQASADPGTGAATLVESLTWQTGWTHYAVPTASLDPDGDPILSYSNTMSPVQTAILGGVCHLTGVVKRTGTTIAANTRVADATGLMFRLPLGWHPWYRVPVMCLCGTTNPPDSITAAVVQTAWVEARPDTDQVAGGIYLISANAAINQNTGWIALGGFFLCRNFGDPNE